MKGNRIYGFFGIDIIERSIYAEICSSDGIKAKDIGKNIKKDKHIINQYLYKSPFMKELCYRDDEYFWHGLIRQCRPHSGLGDFCGYYGSLGEFLQLSEEEWFEELQKGCGYIGRNLNNTRGLFHSFRDSREVILQLLEDLKEVYKKEWEIVFELRINKAKYIRIYADVLIITENKVFSLEFKMKNVIEAEEVLQAAKYVPYLEVLFGPEYDVIPCLVLTRAEDLYVYQRMGNTTAEIPVCSGDMLFNLFDEYLVFLDD